MSTANTIYSTHTLVTLVKSILLGIASSFLSYHCHDAKYPMIVFDSLFPLLLTAIDENGDEAVVVIVVVSCC